MTKTPFQSLFLPSSGTAFGSSQPLSGVDKLPLYGDFDADGRADLAVFNIDDLGLSVDVTTAGGTAEHAFPPIAGHTVIPGPTGDFNGDGRTDLSIEQATQASRIPGRPPVHLLGGALDGHRLRRPTEVDAGRQPNPSRWSPISTATVTTTPSQG